jgi:hypothetical protein
MYGLGWVRAVGLSCLAILALGGVADAAVIQYTASNVSGNVWEYDYMVSGDTFPENDVLVVFFSESLFGPLSSPSVANGDWFLATLDPSTSLPAPGEFDALSLTTFASLADPLKVRVVFLPATGVPGSQHFEIQVFDAQGNYLRTRASGETVAANVSAVPEPATMFLVGAGLLAARRTRRKNTGAL